MTASKPLIGGGRARGSFLRSALFSLGSLVILAVVLSGRYKEVSLENEGQQPLSDHQSEKDMDSFFNTLGMDPKSSVRLSGNEANDQLTDYITSLNSEASLGKHFCHKHPDRCTSDTKAASLKKAQKLIARAAAPIKPAAPIASAAPVTSAGDAAPAARQGKAARLLGDDVMDISPTKAADDGDVHVDSATIQKHMFTAVSKKQRAIKTAASRAAPTQHAGKPAVSAEAAKKQAKKQTLKIKYVNGGARKSTVRRLSKLSAADDAELAKCNVPDGLDRPAYCKLLMDIGMDVDSLKKSLPTRDETEYRYSANNGGHTRPLHTLIPMAMDHEDGANLDTNMVNFGVPDAVVPSEEEHEENNLVNPEPDDRGKLGGQNFKGGPLSPILRDSSLFDLHPDNEIVSNEQTEEHKEIGLHDKYNEKMKPLDPKISDDVVYGLGLDDYKKLGLVLSDDFVSPTDDAEKREAEHGSHPNFFGERFKPLAKYASNSDWIKENNPDAAFDLDDATLLVRPEGEVGDEFAGRSAVEQHLLYGDDFFGAGMAVDSEKDNGGPRTNPLIAGLKDGGFGDQRLKGPGDESPMPAFPRNTLDAMAHPWTDQAHVFYDEVGPKRGGIVDADNIKESQTV